MINQGINDATIGEYLKTTIIALGYECLEDCFQTDTSYLAASIALGKRLIVLSLKDVNGCKLSTRLVNVYTSLGASSDNFIDMVYATSFVPQLTAMMCNVRDVIKTHQKSISYQTWAKTSPVRRVDYFIDEFSRHYATDVNWQIEPVLAKMASCQEYGLMSASELKQALNTSLNLFKQISITCFGHPKYQFDNRALALNEMQHKRESTPMTRHLLKLGACRLLVIIKVF